MPSLFIVATPIGNLSDVSFRAKEVLETVPVILAEDTRVSKKLLDRYGITRRLESVHAHTDPERIAQLLESHHEIDLAYVTDAGTPGVEDPGWRLVEVARSFGYRIVPIPGPSAVATIISVADFPVERPLILGFLPKKKGRQTLFANLTQLKEMKLVDSLIVFESPYQITRTLDNLLTSLGDCRCVLGREMTKQFEEIRYGTLSEVATDLRAQGEFSLLISLN